MNVAHVQEVVEEVTGDLPDGIILALLDVDVHVCVGPLPGIAHDARGAYLGTFPEVGNEDEPASPGNGHILLIADRLTNKDEARSTFLHEIAHALGLDEIEVAELGL